MKAVLVSVVAAAVLAGIPGALVVACESAGYGSWGFPYFVFVSLALAACAVVFFVAFCAENGKLVLQSALFGAVAFGLMSVTLREQFHARTSAFEKLATAAEPRIAAFRDYEAANGRPPARLEDLVPGQLERIPGTGMRAYPMFD
ncbi:MAG: hypothetical protein KDB80_07575 [Planctomycetes bacterium]|nr:hypothetical protein [Planctomycetota bacterium]